jgi:hypothetical protein
LYYSVGGKMVWKEAGKTEYPEEPCMKCANFGFMGCGGCTYPDQDGTCKEFVPENLEDEEETNARWPPREDL